MSAMPPRLPEHWRDQAARLAGAVEVVVAGRPVRAELTEASLLDVYLPLLVSLAGRAEGLGRVQPGLRLIVGLAGIPGAGKSVFAAVLAELAERTIAPNWLAAVGLDGWHYPNSVLNQRWTTEADGHRRPLRERKGGPESYDVPALLAAMRHLRRAGEAVKLPVYDRGCHDVVTDGLMVAAGARVVLLEGNYLLMAAPPWDEVCTSLDTRLFLQCDEAAARRRVIARHISGGLSETEALRKYGVNDGPNSVLIAPTIGRADYILRVS